MEDVYIVDAARSPMGKFLGELSSMSGPKLGAATVRGIISRTEFSLEDIDELIVGNVLSAGEGQNPAKQVAVYSGLPNSIPAYSVNMVCASGLKAVALGADAIRLGIAGVIIAGGTESMSNAPFTVNGIRGLQKLGNAKLGPLIKRLGDAGYDINGIELVDEMINGGLWDCYNDMHMGGLAEFIGKDYNITREEEDAFALESHRKAAEAQDNGKFEREIIPINAEGGIVSRDEGIRRDTDMKKLSALRPAFDPKGIVTAGNSSQLSDGASFLVLMSKAKIDEYGLKPLAKIEAYSAVGNDPKMYGMAPVPAVEKIMGKTGMKLDDMDLIELNEAFCVQTLGVVKALGIDIDKLNVNGGATALGHPIGATGARILTTLVYALQDRKKELGLATLCHGGGGAAAMIVRMV